jgi:hypothetical protein
MTTRISKLLLTSHVSTSVGWLGAVAAFIAVATVCLSASIPAARSLYPGLQVIAWYVIIPFCFASLLTGVLQAALTPWGLFRHYWIIVKLFLTVVMTALLILHLNPINYLAGLAVNTGNTINESATIVDLIIKAGAAAIGLVVITAISIYKPWGAIKRGSSRRNFRESVKFYLIIAFALAVLTIIIVHVLGGGMGKH